MVNRRYIIGKAAALQHARSIGSVEFFALVLLGAAVPFFLRRPQLFVGSVVNFTLAAAALSFSDWRKTIPLVLLPGLSAAVSGVLFGPATLFLFYLLPFIWAGNAVLVLIIRKGRRRGGLFLPAAVPAGALLKTALIFLPAYVLIRLEIVPAFLAVAMGWNQLVAALIGGSVAMFLAGDHHKSTALSLTAILVLACPSAAFAYIDPGTGSYLLQILIAALLGGLFALKVFWGNIKQFFKKTFTRKYRAGQAE